MKVLIELYDSEPIYNYLATMVFRPDRVYFVGDPSMLGDKCKNKTSKLASIMGIEAEFIYRNARSSDFRQIQFEIKKIVEKEKANSNSCIIDVTGGRDLALVASGTLMSECEEIVFYDKNVNAFRLLSSGEMRKVELGVPSEVFITAAGGTVYEKARNIDFTQEEWGIIRNLVRVFFENRGAWNSFVKYLQRVSKKEGEKIGDRLFVDAPLSLTESGRNYSANMEIMQKLEQAGAINSLRKNGDRISFKYRSADFAILIVNEGIWLEMAVYLAAKEMPEFFDAQVGVKFVWDVPDKSVSVGEILADNVPRNEVDVVLSMGVKPVFISCKTREPVNEDLNELYAIKEHFGGEMAVAIMATTKYVGTQTPIYERAKAMGIGFIDERNFENGNLKERLLKLTGGNDGKRHC